MAFYVAGADVVVFVEPSANYLFLKDFLSFKIFVPSAETLTKLKLENLG